MSVEPRPATLGKRSPEADAGRVDVSVVVVTYNSADDIKACLSSLHESGSALRIQTIVVDNGSVDGTAATLSGWKSAPGPTPGLRFDSVLNSRNLGYTRAMNQGLGLAVGQKVLFLNPDTRVEQGALETLAGYLGGHPEVGVVAPQLRNPDGTVQPSCRRFPRRRDLFLELLGLPRLLPGVLRLNRWKMGEFDHRELREVDQPQGACWMTRAEVLATVGLLDDRFPMFFSDVDWCMRVRQAGWKIVFLPEARVVHRKGASVYPNRAAMIWSSHRSFHEYWRKYSGGGGIDRFLNTVLGTGLWITAVLRIVASSVTSRRR